jgi:hypothetical protein
MLRRRLIRHGRRRDHAGGVCAVARRIRIDGRRRNPTARHQSANSAGLVLSNGVSTALSTPMTFRTVFSAALRHAVAADRGTHPVAITVVNYRQ